MIDVLEKRTESLAEILVVSNTPVYLFKHLRNALQNVARRVPLERIVTELRQVLSDGQIQDIRSAIYAYALFTLMTYWEYQDVSPELGWIRESGLRWIREIVGYYERSFSVISESIEFPAIEHQPELGEGPYTTLSSAGNNAGPTVTIEHA
jgi:hypothetical protein